MPHIAWFYYCGLDEGDSKFLGISEYTKRHDFEVKIKALCVAMGWDYASIKSVHCYDNQVQDNF